MKQAYFKPLLDVTVLEKLADLIIVSNKGENETPDIPLDGPVIE